MTRRSLAAVAAGAAALSTLAACAAPKQSLSELDVPVVYVELFPRQASLAVDGRPLGVGPRTVEIRDRAKKYRFHAEAEGFAPVDVEGTGEELAGASIGIVLPPEGFGVQRKLDADDAKSLAMAANLLNRKKRFDDAAQYAQQAVSVRRDYPLAHRELGIALANLGKRKAAIEELNLYLAEAPDAPDAPKVRELVEKAHGDLTIPVDEQ